MRPMLLVPLLLATLAAPASAETAAPVDRQVVRDAGSDAYWEVDGGGTTRPKGVDVVEIESLRVVAREGRVTFRVRVAQLRRVRGADYQSMTIGVHRSPSNDDNLLSTDIGSGKVLTELGSRDEARVCRGASAEVTDDVLVLRVPLRCVGPLRSYRFDVGADVSTSRFYAEDGTALSPRVRLR